MASVWDMTALEDLLGLDDFEPLHGFAWIFWLIWKWNLLSSLFLFVFAALIATCTLRRHRYARYYILLIVLMGFVGPCSWGLLSSLIIAAYWRMGEWKMDRYFTLLFGVGLTIMGLFLSFLRAPSFL
ncbi:transmembrane protein 170A-like [Symsagittifera roscoffensis]|uniref:transmembrane protein 170A-like n=1 Tax=Symsagittifera roscoffensis TaxID=84072 RepID=UPI00307C34B5